MGWVNTVKTRKFNIQMVAITISIPLVPGKLSILMSAVNFNTGVRDRCRSSLVRDVTFMMLRNLPI